MTDINQVGQVPALTKWSRRGETEGSPNNDHQQLPGISGCNEEDARGGTPHNSTERSTARQGVARQSPVGRYANMAAALLPNMASGQGDKNKKGARQCHLTICCKRRARKNKIETAFCDVVIGASATCDVSGALKTGQYRLRRFLMSMFVNEGSSFQNKYANKTAVKWR